MDIETEAPVDELEALDAVEGEDEELVAYAEGSQNLTACS